ncbi:MAG: hypothetical protein HYX66_08650 [Ignavibacteria bacterium]|jgi:hypothetical protein|nr:hypothetical protein [Ignavibacteria bacterium]
MKYIRTSIATAVAVSIISCSPKEEPKPMDEAMPSNHENMQMATDTMKKDSMKDNKHEEMKHEKDASGTDVKRQEIKSVTTQEKSVRIDEQPAVSTQEIVRDTSGSKKVKKLSRPR